MVVLVVALVVFGPNKLPEVARQAGKAMRTFRKISNSFRDEIRDAMAQPVQTGDKPAAAEPAGIDPASSLPSEQSNGQPGDQLSGQPNEQSSEQPGDQLSGQPSEQFGGQPDSQIRE